MKDIGWISIHRQLKGHWIWEDPTKLKWWLDILLSVNTSPVKMNIGNDLIECKRGQSIKSLQTWAAEWKTSKDKVRNFFKLLEKDGMITLENIKISTRLTVCKYDTYQAIPNAKPTPSKREPNGSQTQTHPNNNDNNSNNENNDNKSSLPAGSKEPKGQEILELFNELTGRQFKGISDKTERQIAKLKKLNHSLEDFKTAIKNGQQSAAGWSNPSLFTPEYITRQDKFLQFLNWQQQSTPAAAKNAPAHQYGIKHLDPTAPDYYDRLKEHYAVSKAS